MSLMQKEHLFSEPRKWPFLCEILALSVPKIRGVVNLRIKKPENNLNSTNLNLI